MTSQKKDYEWYEAHLEELYSQYAGKQLVISDEKVVGAYDTFEEALAEALKSLEAGTFIIQEAVEKIVPIQYYNRAVFF